MSKLNNKYSYCAVCRCPKNRRLDNRPRHQWAYVKDSELLKKLHLLNEEVCMNDPVCVDCRWYANEEFKNRRNTQIENIAESHVQLLSDSK